MFLVLKGNIMKSLILFRVDSMQIWMQGLCFMPEFTAWFSFTGYFQLTFFRHMASKSILHLCNILKPSLSVHACPI